MKRRWLQCAGAAGAFLVAAAMLMGATMQRAQAPVDENLVSPPPARETAEQKVRVGKDCSVVQTMRFSRCGHSVTRRVAAPAVIQGMDFAGVQGYYALWQVQAFSEELIEMGREVSLYCPMHKVLSVNEAGEIVLTENVYGDGMAVVKTYDADIGDMREESRDQLLLGLGFDSAEEAEAWLALH